MGGYRFSRLTLALLSILTLLISGCGFHSRSASSRVVVTVVVTATPTPTRAALPAAIPTSTSSTALGPTTRPTGSTQATVAPTGTEVPAPARPTGFTAKALSSDAVQLVWNDDPDETSYTLYRRAGGVWTRLVQLGQDVTKYVDEGLDPGRRYGYRLRAESPHGSSRYAYTATTTAGLNVTSAPTNTPTPTPTFTPAPTNTPTQVPTATDTPVPTPSGSGMATTISRLPTSRKVVALTFDAGADRGYAAQVLQTLESDDIRGTFGITGRWAQANPDLVKRMARDGDLIINHTWDHRSFTGYSTGTAPLTYDQRAQELWDTHSLLLDLAGVSTKPYFRPPYGDYDQSVLREVYSRGYIYNVMWTVDSLGWRGLSKDQIIQRCLDNLQPGDIYLFHVGSQSQDAAALPQLIQDLKARGYSFARIGDYYR